MLRFAAGGPAIKGPMATLEGARQDGDRQLTDAARTVRRRRCALLERHQRATDAHADARRGRGREVPRTGRLGGRFNYFTTTKGGKTLEPYAGKAEGTITFTLRATTSCTSPSRNYSGRAAAPRAAAGPPRWSRSTSSKSGDSASGRDNIGFPCFGGETRSSCTHITNPTPQNRQPHSPDCPRVSHS